MTVASRIVLSYPAALSAWGRGQVETSRFRNYLRRVVDPVEGAEFEEFVDVGGGGEFDERLDDFVACLVVADDAELLDGVVIEQPASAFSP